MKYFEPFKTGFLHDVAGLRAWLEKRGKLNCNDKVLEELWTKFSDDYDAQWLVFNANDAEDFWLNKFLDWLKYEEKEYGED